MSKNRQENNHDDILLTWVRSREHRDMLLAWTSSHDISNWHCPFAVTLRFKRGTTRQEVVGNINYFLNRLNEKIFKHAYRRHGKYLKSISTAEWSWEEVEKGQSQRDPHVHMVIESPPLSRMSEEEFFCLVKEQWNKTDKGITEIAYYKKGINKSRKGDINVFHMEKMYLGWLGYISKSKTKLSGDDILVDTWKV